MLLAGSCVDHPAIVRVQFVVVVVETPDGGVRSTVNYEKEVRVLLRRFVHWEEIDEALRDPWCGDSAKRDMKHLCIPRGKVDRAFFRHGLTILRCPNEGLCGVLCDTRVVIVLHVSREGSSSPGESRTTKRRSSSHV